MTLTVDVTAEDIEEGEASSCRRCPVALALNRAYGGDCSALVGDARISLWDREAFISAAIPTSVRRFTQAFDDKTTRDDAKPFTFTLELEAVS